MKEVFCSQELSKMVHNLTVEINKINSKKVNVHRTKNLENFLWMYLLKEQVQMLPYTVDSGSCVTQFFI
jgi:hypothetical protein